MFNLLLSWWGRTACLTYGWVSAICLGCSLRPVHGAAVCAVLERFTVQTPESSIRLAVPTGGSVAVATVAEAWYSFMHLLLFSRNILTNFILLLILFNKKSLQCAILNALA